MENTNTLRVINKRSWRMGFTNLFNANNTKYWHTKKWIVQTVFWLLFVNGMLAVMIWSISAEQVPKAFASLVSINDMKAVQQNPLASILMEFLAMYALALPIGAIIAGQDSIIGERQSGTAAWVLSKPVSRPAFVLSKLASSAMGILITGVVIQGVVAYIQLSLRIGAPWPIAGFLGVMGLILLSLFFYITLTYMLGAIFASRGAILGISLGVALMGPSMLRSMQFIKDITPWTFFIPALEEVPVGLSLAFGQSPQLIVTIICTALFSLLFTVITLLRFRREEF